MGRGNPLNCRAPLLRLVNGSKKRKAPCPVSHSTKATAQSTLAPHMSTHGMAAELVTGEIEVSSVVTNDDVAVEDSSYTAGRRGVGATVLVEKIAGAAAESGASLDDVSATASRVNAQARSMGLALTSCIVPTAGPRAWRSGLALPRRERSSGSRSPART